MWRGLEVLSRGLSALSEPDCSSFSPPAATASFSPQPNQTFPHWPDMQLEDAGVAGALPSSSTSLISIVAHRLSNTHRRALLALGWGLLTVLPSILLQGHPSSLSLPLCTNNECSSFPPTELMREPQHQHTWTEQCPCRQEQSCTFP